MRRNAIVILGLLLCGAPISAQARERPLEDFPKDVWNLATVWTEPLKAVARDTRRFDPVSGLCFGLFEGSVKSVERTSDFFLPPNEKRPRPTFKEGKAILRYSF